MGVRGYKDNFKLTLVPERLEQPLKRKKPTMYFVNSMSDLFHKDVPTSYINKVFSIIRKTPQHTYQILTKRAGRLASYCKTHDIPDNAWMGVSVEDRKYGLPRIEYLRKINASIRFLSIEPLLDDVGEIDLTNIHWVIVGGESGPKARPMKQEWVDSIKHQCDEQDVAFFFKQWGGWGADGKKRAKKANGRTYKGKIWDNMPLSL
jgi:protein gp37